MRGHTKSLDANDKLIQTRSHVRNAIASRERQVVMRKVKSTIDLNSSCIRYFSTCLCDSDSCFFRSETSASIELIFAHANSKLLSTATTRFKVVLNYCKALVNCLQQNVQVSKRWFLGWFGHSCYFTVLPNCNVLHEIRHYSLFKWNKSWCYFDRI